MGPKITDRLLHAHEQGPRGHRGPRAVRGRLRPDRRSSFTPSRSSTRWSSSSTAPPWPSSRMPDMRLPIGYALGYPDRLAPPVRRRSTGPRSGRSTSSRPTAPSSRASTSPTRRAGRGGLAPAWLNAANEVAVAAFLDGRIGWARYRRGGGRRRCRIVSTTPSRSTRSTTSLEADRAARDAGRPTSRRQPRARRLSRLDRARHRRPRQTAGCGAASTPAAARAAPAPARAATIVGRWRALSWRAVVTRTTSVLIVIVAVVVMIMVHELGHFVTAKWSRMKVTEFFVGFGPRLWSIRRGETEYGVKAIPAGGYVKILGMTNLEEVDPARRGPHLPAAAVPQPDHRGRRPGRPCTSSWPSCWSGACSSSSARPVELEAGGSRLLAVRRPAASTRPSAPGCELGDVIVAFDGHRRSATRASSPTPSSDRAGSRLSFVVDRRRTADHAVGDPGRTAGASCTARQRRAIGVPGGSASHRAPT